MIYDEEKADFRGMIELAEGENLCVTKILQKACIEVNEKGSAVAAPGTCTNQLLKNRTNV